VKRNRTRPTTTRAEIRPVPKNFFPNDGFARDPATCTRGRRPVFTERIHWDRESLNRPRSLHIPRVIFVDPMSDLFHEDVPLF
jgi:protein gp37